MAFLISLRRNTNQSRVIRNHRILDIQIKRMKKQFKHFGDFGCYYFLYVVGEPVPQHDEFRAKLLDGAQKEKKPTAAKA